MKRIISAIAFVSIAFAMQAQSIDISKSSMKWKGEKVTGFHEGTIQIKTAQLTEKNNKITAGSFTIDMTSIICSDLEDPTYNAKLVGHLKSDDFFAVEKYKTASFTITSTSVFTNGEAKIRGNMTIKGKTNPIEFHITKTGTAYTAQLVVDRSKYDVTYGSGSFFDDLGDNLIYDNFYLDIYLAVK